MQRIDDEVTAIQVYYPLIYMACHTEHRRARSSPVRLSARDSGILAHLTDRTFASPGKLAKHLGISASTLSEALRDLSALGYIKRVPNERDDRKIDLKLTSKGLEAMKQSSVLDSERVAKLLARLKPEHRNKAVEGLRLLAAAATNP